MKHQISRTVPATGSSGVGNAISDIKGKTRKANRAARVAGKTARTGITATTAGNGAMPPSSVPWTTVTATRTAAG